MTDIEYRMLKGRLTEDEHYDLVREFLVEGLEGPDVPTAYIEDREGRMVFTDPNSGRVISKDLRSWDEADYEKFFRQNGITSLIVRDSMGSISTGEYGTKAFLRKLNVPRRAQTFKIVKGQKESVEKEFLRHKAVVKNIGPLAMFHGGTDKTPVAHVRFTDEDGVEKDLAVEIDPSLKLQRGQQVVISMGNDGWRILPSKNEGVLTRPKIDGQKLQDALLDSDWPGVK